LPMYPALSDADQLFVLNLVVDVSRD
jgi:hypothetical protein